MSKSRGNVVNPDEIMDQFGADAVRLYEMFMGPLEAVKPWSTRGVEGVTRFLERAWRLMVNEEGRLSSTVVGTVPTLEHQRLLHQTIKKVTEDIEALRFNTAISQMMVFTNEMTKAEQRSRALLKPFVLILAPFAPHLAEELWEVLGHQPSVSQQPWPIFDPSLTVSDRLTIPIQVNGKLRDQTRRWEPTPLASRSKGWLVPRSRNGCRARSRRRLCMSKKADELCPVNVAEIGEKSVTCESTLETRGSLVRLALSRQSRVACGSRRLRLSIPCGGSWAYNWRCSGDILLHVTATAVGSPDLGE